MIFKNKTLTPQLKEELKEYIFDIIGHLHDVYRKLPWGFPEYIYQEALDITLKEKNLPHKKYDDTPTLAKGTWWLRQGHVFGSPFYYIDYTLAQVVAFQFLAEDLKNHDKAWKKYVKLCKMGGKLPFTGLLEKDHLRNPFEDGNVRKNIKPWLKVLKEFDTSKF